MTRAVKTHTLDTRQPRGPLVNIRRSTQVSGRRRVIQAGVAALLALSWGGCGSDDDTAGSDGDLGPPPGEDPGDLVGTWHHAGERGQSETWRMGADGSFHYERTAEDGATFVLQGEYSVDDDTIHTVGEYPDTPGTTVVSELTFYAGPDRASIPAYVPLGDNDGWVGSWTMRYHNRLVHDDGGPDTLEGGEEVVDLRTDGSASWRLTYDDGTEQLVTGTWSEGDGTIELVELVDGAEVPWSFPTLDGAALAQFPLEREE